jgi:SAM-dependent methyltransferase
MKYDFTDEYSQSTPDLLLRRLGLLTYVAPAVMAWIFGALQKSLGRAFKGNILDVGCSYGINSMALGKGLTLANVYRLADTNGLSVNSLRAMPWLTPDIRVIGHDVSSEALTFAEEAELIDRRIDADLEVRGLSDEEQRLVGEVDLVISSGAIGYVSEHSFGQLIRSTGDRPLSGIATCAEWYDMDGIVHAMEAEGLGAVVHTDITFPQRRVSDPTEAEWIDGQRSGSGRYVKDSQWLTCHPLVFGRNPAFVSRLSTELSSQFEAYRHLGLSTMAELLLAYELEEPSEDSQS